MKKIGVSLILLILLFSFGQLTYGATDPTIQQGKLSVQNWNFKQQGSIDLSGEWSKYEKKLLSPQKVKEEEVDSFSEPGLWHDYSIFGKKLSFLKEMKSGYATYHLTLEDIDQTQANTLKIGKIANSYKVWINGDLVAENGEVGRKIDLESPKIKEQMIELPEANNIDIVIQLSNFHFKQKRLTPYLENIKLGTKEQLQTDNVSHIILLTSLFLVFIMFFFAYLFRGRDKQLYYFALFNALLVLKIGLFSDWLDLGLIEKITYWYQTKIDILFSIAIVVVFVKYLKTLYPKLFSDIIFRIILSLGTVISLTVLVSSVQLYNGMFIYGQIVLAILIVYLLYTILTGLVKGKIDYFITGILFISLVVIYDLNLVLNDLLLVNT
ncbi:MAG: 7TM diverse intracellular signaling domain-containing protein, partial [Halanaerobiales bacterium]